MSAVGVILMRVFRVIFLACLISVLTGTAFAKNDKDKGDKDWGYWGGKGKGGETYTAPEFNFAGSLKYELLAIAAGSVVLLERRRRRRRASVK
jgi:hypothetical protein